MPGVAIVQSSYVPWRGYFSLIASSDVFVFLDTVQFTRRDWRSRNRIKTAQGAQWLTVPVRQRGNFHAAIEDIEVADSAWAEKHVRMLQSAYARAPAFSEVFPSVRDAYATCADANRLSEVNIHLTSVVCSLLGLKTRLVRDIDLMSRQTSEAVNPTERLVRLVEAAGGAAYLSGPAARGYLDEGAFADRGLSVRWADYSRLTPYPQLWGVFDPQVSILDALFNLGPQGARASLDEGL